MPNPCVVTTESLSKKDLLSPCFVRTIHLLSQRRAGVSFCGMCL